MAVAVTYRGDDLTAANCGMNFYKLSQAEYLMDSNEVPEEGRFVAMTAKQRKNLRDDIIANHSDDSAALEWARTGYLKNQPLMGFTPILSQRCVLNTSTDVRTCPFWHQSAIGLGIWTEKKVHMDILPTKRHSLQIRTVMNAGASRLEELGVGVIYADESP
jgi:hypothetical protein